MRSVHVSAHARATIDASGIGTLEPTNAGRLNIIGSAAIAELRAALQALASLVHERCAVGSLDELVARRAQSLAALPPRALRQQKRLLQHWQTVPLAAMGAFLARKRSRTGA